MLEKNIFPISDLEIIQKIIPQRFPIIMVGELLSYDFQTLTSGLQILSNNIFVQNNEFQPTGIIEHQAQSVAMHTGFKFFIENKIPPTGYIGAIKNVQIFSLPQVNEKIFSDIKILNEISGVSLVEILTYTQTQKIAQSEMKTIIKKEEI